jgi:hypothetical protein
MNSTLMNTQFPLANISQKNTSLHNMKVVVFPIGSLNCAINIFSIYKVVKSTRFYGEDNNWVSMTRVGDREVTILLKFILLFYKTLKAICMAFLLMGFLV